MRNVLSVSWSIQEAIGHRDSVSGSSWFDGMRRLRACLAGNLGELVEGLWPLAEVVQLKNGLWVRQLVFLQVVVQPGFGAPEIRDACTCM